MIGFIDLDLFYTRTLSQPNYELCVTATYYKLQGRNVRLIVDTSIKNLKRYEKIYVFRSHRFGLSVAQLIDGYYQLNNIEEYGEGFPNRPLMPDIDELVYTQPSPEIYHPLINFLEKTGSKKYRLMHKTWFYNYQLTKYFYSKDGELLVRHITPQKVKRILIYDNPLLFFTQDKAIEVLNNLISSNKTIQFATPLDISLLDKENFESLMNNKYFNTLRKTLFASINNDNVRDFLRWVENNKGSTKAATLSISMNKNESWKYYLLNGLRIITLLPERLGTKVRVFPKMTYEITKLHYLIRWFNSWHRRKIGSFYEYAVWKTYRKEIERKNLNGKIDSVTVDFLFRNYGMRAPIIALEKLMYSHKEAEELLMRGGKSYYGYERSKYSYIGGTPREVEKSNFRIRKDRLRTATANSQNRRY